MQMEHLSLKLLSETVINRRKSKKLSQTALAKETGINRSILSRLELMDYTPSVDQLLSLSSVLDFKLSDVLTEDSVETVRVSKKKITAK